MKTIKKASLLFASLALVLGAGLVGNSDTKEVKAEEIEASTTITSENSAAAWTDNGKTHLSIKLSNDGGSNNPKFYTSSDNSSSDIRIYSKNYFTISKNDSFSGSIKIHSLVIFGKGSHKTNTQTLNYSSNGTLVKSGAQTITFVKQNVTEHTISFDDVNEVNLYQSGSNNIQISKIIVNYYYSEPVKEPSIKLNVNSTVLDIGTSGTFTATIENASNPTITWESSNADVLEITNASTGAYIAHAVGTTTIKVSMICDESPETKITASTDIEVIDPNAHEITITGDSEVEVSKTITLVASCSKEDNITWKCEPETVATISKDGAVTGVSEGEAIVTATCENGTKATYTIKVNKLVTQVNTSIDFSNKGYTNQQVITSAKIDSKTTISFDKATGNNDPKYYTTGKAVRVYANNTFTIKLDDSNKKLTSISLTFDSGDDGNTITTDVGTFSSTTWTGVAQSVTFTVGGAKGHRRIVGIDVTYEDVAAKFIEDWAALRANGNAMGEGKSQGICYYLTNGTRADLDALIDRYNKLSAEDKAIVDKAPDGGTTIANTIEYVSGLLAKLDDKSSSGNSGVVITSNNSYDKTSLIALFAILGIVTISGYYIIEKKKFSK